MHGAAWEALTPEIPSTQVGVYAIYGLRRRRAGVPRCDARPLSRFVGRTQELALLHARLAQAIGGQGQVIGIAGEPGMGKSRLLVEFACGLDGQPVTYCEGHCLAYGSATPYLPVRDLLRQLWTLPDAAPAPTITATIHQRLREARVASEAEVLLLLQLLDVPMDLAPLAALSPEMRKARTFALLRHLLRHASQRQPLLLAVENLHWSDPTSEEWLASLVEQLGDMPVLLLVTYRPGYQPPWLRHSAATQMALPRLSPHDSLVVLQPVPQAVQLPASLQQAIVAKAAGNPFFVEELTWAAVAHGNHAGPLPLPDTIEAVLAARLDSLPPEAKRLVQIAAVIGPEVPVPLLQTIAGLSEGHCSVAWRTSRPRSSCMRRCSSRARSIPSNMLSPTRSPTAVCCRSDGGCSMPVSWRPLRRSLEIRWPSRSNAWPITPCGVRCGTRPWRIPSRRGRRPWRVQPTAKRWATLSRRWLLPSISPRSPPSSRRASISALSLIVRF